MYPALTALGLGETDFEQLRMQGFVARERRKNHTYFKLRYRVAGRQHVRYIASGHTAALVRAELQRLQADTVAGRQRRALEREARRLLRDAKQMLQPLLTTYGFHFHGQAIRQSRRARSR
jgi:hypothetical protein